MDKAEDDLEKINVDEPVEFEQPVEAEAQKLENIKPKSQHKYLAGILFILTMLISMSLGAFIVWYFIFNGEL